VEHPPAGERDIPFAGGAGLVRRFTLAWPLDELLLPIVPLAVRTGTRLFGGAHAAAAL